jgi:hypothetical protein
MMDGKTTFNVLESIEKHINALKPLLPKQALVCIGEYPIKMLLKTPDVIIREEALLVLIEKSSDEIYKWLPKDYTPHFVLGFEDQRIDTHFWYNVLPTISRNRSVLESLGRKDTEKLQSAIIFSSVWDGVGSATLPTLIGKFKATNIDSLAIAVLPSKIQPTDAHFNSYASLEMCLSIEGATVILIDRDLVESYEGVDRKGELLKGNMVANYLLNLLLSKDELVQEISELSRTFNTKLFTPIVVTGASYRIYGSLENMLNTALLKPFLTFDLSSATLLYVVLRMPLSLKDNLPRDKIELSITKWFKEKTSLQSIIISEPIYTQDMSDRIDAVLFVGGFDMSKIMSDLETKVQSLKNQAAEKGFMTADGRVELKIEEPLEQEPKAEEPATITQTQILNVEEPDTVIEAAVTRETENKVIAEVAREDLKSADLEVSAGPSNVVGESQVTIEPLPVGEEPKSSIPKRTRKTKKVLTKKKTKKEKVDAQKQQTSA